MDSVMKKLMGQRPPPQNFWANNNNNNNNNNDPLDASMTERSVDVE